MSSTSTDRASDHVTADARTVRGVSELQAEIASWHAEGMTVGYVPTMGALHEGHMALVEAAQQRNDRVLVSIFVNPLQFAEGEDFDRYPRMERADLQRCAAADVDLVWLPDSAELFPGMGKAGGFGITVDIPAISGLLCGQRRPTHFSGVATEMARVMQIVGSDDMYLGEKDFQQLVLLRQVARDLALPIVVHGVPTVRADDGLAVSSRNLYLSAEERAVAPQFYATLSDAAAQLARPGSTVDAVLDLTRVRLLEAGFTEVEYLELVSSTTLESKTATAPSDRLVAAVWLGSTRLLDNVELALAP